MLKPLTQLVCHVTRFTCGMTRVRKDVLAIWHVCPKDRCNKTTDNEMMYSKETDEASRLIYLGATFLLPLFSGCTEN